MQQIVEVLLARKQVLAALRFSAKYPGMSVPVRRFLEVAVEQNDDSIFYVTLRHFTARGLLTPDCRPFTRLFKQRFAPVSPLPPSF